MKAGMAAGLATTRQIKIDLPRTIDFLGEELRIYATPEFVRDVEWTCRDFLLGFAETGEDSVGIGVNLTHSGATLLGMAVEIEARIKEVSGRQVVFSIVARDGAEEIGRGEHSRFMVEVAKLKARVAAKAAKVAVA